MVAFTYPFPNSEANLVISVNESVSPWCKFSSSWTSNTKSYFFSVWLPYKICCQSVKCMHYVQWHSSEGNSTGDISAINHKISMTRFCFKFHLNLPRANELSYLWEKHHHLDIREETFLLKKDSPEKKMTYIIHCHLLMCTSLSYIYSCNNVLLIAFASPSIIQAHHTWYAFLLLQKTVTPQVNSSSWWCHDIHLWHHSSGCHQTNCKWY